MKHRPFLLAALMAAGLASPDDAPAQFPGAPVEHHHYVRDPWRNWDRNDPGIQDFNNHYGRVPTRSYDATGNITIGIQSWNSLQHGHDYSIQLRRDNHYLGETRRSYDVIDTRGRVHDDHHYRRQDYYERRY